MEKFTEQLEGEIRFRAAMDPYETLYKLITEAFNKLGFTSRGMIENRLLFDINHEFIDKRVFASYNLYNNMLFVTAPRFKEGIIISGMVINTADELLFVFDRLRIKLKTFKEFTNIGQ